METMQLRTRQMVKIEVKSNKSKTGHIGIFFLSFVIVAALLSYGVGMFTKDIKAVTPNFEAIRNLVIDEQMGAGYAAAQQWRGGRVALGGLITVPYYRYQAGDIEVIIRTPATAAGASATGLVTPQNGSITAKQSEYVVTTINNNKGTETNKMLSGAEILKAESLFTAAPANTSKETDIAPLLIQVVLAVVVGTLGMVAVRFVVAFVRKGWLERVGRKALAMTMVTMFIGIVVVLVRFPMFAKITQKIIYS